MVSCENQEEITITFEQNEFIPKTTEEVKHRVEEFLSHTATTSDAVLRSDYEDKEVNEGFWTLEAAANYISNVNLDNKLETTITYTLNINNKVADGIIKMDGPDMTAKFDELQTLIDESASDLGQVAKIVDAKLVSANDQQTTVQFNVFYGLYFPPPPPPPASGCEWAGSTVMVDAGGDISQCINDNISSNNFYSSVIDFSGEDEDEICFWNYEFFIMHVRGGYDPFTAEEMEIHYDECMDFINCAIEARTPDDGSIHIHGPLIPAFFSTDTQPGFLFIGTEFIFIQLILGRVAPYG